MFRDSSPASELRSRPCWATTVRGRGRTEVVSQASRDAPRPRNRPAPLELPMDRFLRCDTEVRHLVHLRARRISLLALLLLGSAAAGNEGKTVRTVHAGVERRFVVGSKISNGAFCNGYRGHEVGTSRPVAIKILRSSR